MRSFQLFEEFPELPKILGLDSLVTSSRMKIEHFWTKIGGLKHCVLKVKWQALLNMFSQEKCQPVTNWHFARRFRAFQTFSSRFAKPEPSLVSIMKGLIWFSKASCDDDDDNVILCTKAMQRLAIKRLRTSSPPHFLNFKEKQRSSEMKRAMDAKLMRNLSCIVHLLYNRDSNAFQNSKGNSISIVQF